MTFEVQHLSDQTIPPELDERIRNLLVTCFPHEPVFRLRRYCKEPPENRFVVFDKDNLIAHVAVHTKSITTNEGRLPIGGIAEVAVHPSYRRMGLVKKTLAAAHEYLRTHDTPFAFLFGHSHVYSSSGYVTVPNVLRYWDEKRCEWVTEVRSDAMVCSLMNIRLPSGQIDINGPTF
jgi:predicted N-acetyltransferase YhbS